MSTLYIVAGLPGTGKTTLSEYLQRELGVPLFCKDKMKEILFDVVGFQSPQGKEQLDRASTEILYYDAAASPSTSPATCGSSSTGSAPATTPPTATRPTPSTTTPPSSPARATPPPSWRTGTSLRPW